MPFKKILCPVDFSTGSQQALRQAAWLAREADAELVLAHVWYLPTLAVAKMPVLPPDSVQAIIDDEERALVEAAAEAARLGVQRVETTFLTGVPWRELIELARGDTAIDLVVIGTHGRTGLDRVLLGSVAERVIRQAPCPVLAVPARGEVSAFRHVLCPVDLSERSREAMALAAELATAHGAALTLLHVIEAPVRFSGEPHVEGFAEVLDKHGTQLLEAWANELRARSSTPVTVRWRIGSPGSQVLAALDADRTVDLVVMASHGRTGLRRALLGSVAEKVVRHADRAVVITHQRAASAPSQATEADVPCTD